MYALGIHGNFGKSSHDAAAVLIKDNKIIAAAEEERFVRYKHAVGLMPDTAIQYCLKEARIDMKQIDVVAFPVMTWQDFRPRLKSYLWYNFGHTPRVEYVDHHTAHAASTYLISGFSSALILTLDQSGDGISCGVFRGAENNIKLVDKIPFPNSLGLFAAFITQYLGFRSNHDEYKVMGLSAYGKPVLDLSELITFQGGDLKLNQKHLHPEVFKRHPLFHTKQLPMFRDAKYSFLPPRRIPGSPILEQHKDLAASAQKAIEDAVFSIIEKYREKDDVFLCLGGGVAENSVVNGKLAGSGLFEDIYISPACNDAGSALGAALYAANKRGFVFTKVIQNKWGPSYNNGFVKRTLTGCGIKHKFINSPAETASKLLENGQTVGWFQGKLEFGPRALGSRSILADPSNRKMKLKVNRIKKREEFRPFSPSVLSDHHSELFSTYQFSPFMSFTLPTTKKGRRELYSATHIDATGRLQSVEKDGSLYREMIESFYRLTNIPAVLNTSFNSGWEPIVENPYQALAFFYSSEIDALVIENYLVVK